MRFTRHGIHPRFSWQLVVRASKDDDEMCHGKKRGEKCRTKGEEEQRAKGTRWFADYLASRASSDYKVYPFTGWELPEEAGDARGVICTQKREAKPRYATRAFRGKKGKARRRGGEKRVKRVFTRERHAAVSTPLNEGRYSDPQLET